MARRYFYDYYTDDIRTIFLRWGDSLDAYDCRIGRDYKVTVGAPACLTKAVDSPEAYDDAAWACLVFAHEEGAIGDYGPVLRTKEA